MRLPLFSILSVLLMSASCQSDTLTKMNPLDGFTESSKSSDKTASSISSEYMTLINTHRENLGLEPLMLDEEMSKVALTHSANMASGKVSFGHTGFSQRCSENREIMGGGNLCGEIVAAGQSTVQKVFTSWMNSSGHRSKIEEPRYTHTGFGYAKNAEGKMYWTQVFLQVE